MPPRYKVGRNLPQRLVQKRPVLVVLKIYRFFSFLSRLLNKAQVHVFSEDLVRRKMTLTKTLEPLPIILDCTERS